MRYRTAFAAGFVALFLIMALACTSPATKPAAQPPDTAARRPESVATAPPLIAVSLGAMTPPTEPIGVAAAGDTLKLTRYWTPSKGSGTWMLVTGGSNKTGGVTAKPDTVAYAAAQATLILPATRPAPGDSVSLWSCQQAITSASQGGTICASVWFRQPSAPVTTPPADSVRVSSIKAWVRNATLAPGATGRFCAFLTLSNGAVTAGASTVTGTSSAYCDSVGRALYTVRFIKLADATRRWPRAMLTMSLR